MHEIFGTGAFAAGMCRMTAVRSGRNRPVVQALKRVVGRLAAAARPAQGAPAHLPLEDSRFFSSLFADEADASRRTVSWRAREAEVDAKAFDRSRGTVLFTELWGSNRLAAAVAPSNMAKLTQYLHFVQVPADREVIGQDELGDYALLILAGRMAVDRMQRDGSRQRVAEAGPGDLLGEVSFLDAGTRLSACRTLQPTTLAVLEAARMDDLCRDQPHLAAAFVASLARRLSLRLRQVSVRLSALLGRGDGPTNS
jgi:CRP/FNR family cyclic AMP-dependent transcriptional regulator